MRGPSNDIGHIGSDKSFTMDLREHDKVECCDRGVHSIEERSRDECSVEHEFNGPCLLINSSDQFTVGKVVFGHGEGEWKTRIHGNPQDERGENFM